MMREIKFRGKRVDTGEWVYGYYAQWDEPYDNGCVEHLYREGVWVHHVIVDRQGHADEVIPETVGQCTGMKDKNGVEIFEGDLVRLMIYGYTSDVEIKLETSSENQYGHGCSSTSTFTGYSLSVDNRVENVFSLCEVIGNIHDKEANHG